MKHPTEEEIASHLLGIIADGFNRSLGALLIPPDRQERRVIGGFGADRAATRGQDQGQR